MGLQLIFVVETKKTCKSDWIYIKDTIDRFFEYNQTQVKLSPVYMDGKGKYKTKEKEIKSLVNQYAATSKTNQSKVFFCFDCDDYDLENADKEFLKEAKRYCADKGYDFIWFCKDIERVYIGKKVADNQKKKEAAMFKEKKLIQKVDAKSLQVEDYRANTSNILKVIGMYLSRK